MRKLHARRRSLLAHKSHDGPPCVYMRSKIHAGVSGRDPATGLNGSRFRENQSGASHGPAPQMHQMPWLRMTIHSRILTHRRNDYPVF